MCMLFLNRSLEMKQISLISWIQVTFLQFKTCVFVLNYILVTVFPTTRDTPLYKLERKWKYVCPHLIPGV